MRYLVDVDGVCADFVGGVLTVLRQRGLIASRNSITQWDIGKALGLLGWQERMMWQDICQPGFAQGLSLIAGAYSGVAALEQHGEVVFATSPVPGSPTWVYDRWVWLRDRMGADRARYAPVANKALLRGDVLIDDREENITAFLDAGGHLGVLFDAPHNQWARLDEYGPRAVRAVGWKGVREVLGV